MATFEVSYPLEGGCDCGTIRYRMETSPLVVHCCHCTWCQRETGSAFVLNALIESNRLTLLTTTEPLLVPVPSASGRGQTIARCPKCYIALWSYYGGLTIRSFVRVGTLDEKDKIEPDVHFYTSSKLEWVDLSASKWEGKVFEEYYDHEKVWRKESLERLEKMMDIKKHCEEAKRKDAK
ncbi:hypothetical protein PRK78_006713 [Emydomyces testavorans]|uniref:CENP-V/GFA domain-containing protein n=1 Tax=Emydomyces testavorans TaxID=2070801 RepID=A0AAF0DN04_9EURO|nr:hypothetical protein PRK78_006713 [Emydomyces testavorans]